MLTRLKRATAVSLIIAVIASVSVGCGGKSELTNEQLKTEISQDDSGWQAADGTVTLENSRIKFSLDAATTHFTVTDKKTNRTALSAAPDGVEFTSEDISAKMKSEISITYYSDQSDAYHMHSATDSVEKESFRVLTDGKTVRVYYTMGEKDELVPELFDEESFESLLDRLNDDVLRRRFKLYYQLYSPEDDEDDRPDNYGDMKEKYPVLKKRALYIADENLTDIDRADISDYLNGIGYTRSEYDKMLDKLGIEMQNGNKNPGYVIPIEYTITEDGFSAQVLSDRIEERSEEYKLQRIDILPYFDSSENIPGSFFAPDGSGALFNYNSGADEVSFPCYGEDYSMRTDSLKSVSKNAALPVFGSSVSSGGYFTVITGASEAAEIVISPKSSSSPLNHAYASFVMRSMDVNDYSDMDIPIYNIFQKDIIKVFPAVRYYMLDSQSNSYYGMADIYRGYLAENGIIGDNVKDKTPVYIDYLCMITERTSMMGVPYSKKIVLSTIEEITESVKSLTDSGIAPTVRLIGYGSAGFEHKAYTEFDLDRRVGTKKQLKALQKLLEDNGGKLYLDADMQFAYKNGNGFSASKDSARYLNRLQNRRGSYDIVTHEYNTGALERYFISPVRYEEYAGLMAESVKKEWNGSELPGFSFGSSGLYLGGDYTKNRVIDRTQSSVMAVKAFENTKKSGISMMFDNGNAYVLPYAEDIVNVPMVSSQTDAQSETVPFLQMVIHSSVNYAGTPFNLSENSLLSTLSAVESGGAPYAAFITRSDSLIADTDYKSVWYSLSDSDRLEQFAKSAKSIVSVLDAVSGKRMTGHSVNGDVSCTTYEDGTKIYVNYGMSDADSDGVTVPAHGFIAGGK